MAARPLAPILWVSESAPPITSNENAFGCGRGDMRRVAVKDMCASVREDCRFPAQRTGGGAGGHCAPCLAIPATMHRMAAPRGRPTGENGAVCHTFTRRRSVKAPFPLHYAAQTPPRATQNEPQRQHASHYQRKSPHDRTGGTQRPLGPPHHGEHSRELRCLQRRLRRAGAR